jgi:hypothetical protein
MGLTSDRLPARASTVVLVVLAANGCSSSAASSFAGSVDEDAASDGATVATDAGAPTARDATVTAFSVGDGSKAATGCEPGTYAGGYDGTFQTVIPTTGPVTITLTRSLVSVGENDLVTSGGTWDTTWGPGIADASLPVEEGHAQLAGQLDCNADTFTATGQNAYFTILGQDAGTFTLSLMGTYDPSTQTIAGTFSYMSTDGNGGGSWQVTLTD